MARKNEYDSGVTKKTITLVGIAVAAIALVVVATALIVNRSEAVAVVNGEKITKKELYQAMYEQIGKRTLDDLITERLIMQEADEQGVKVSEDEVQKRYQEIIDQNFSSEEELLQALQMYNMSKDELMENIQKELIMRKILGKDVKVTEEDMKKYFEENKEQFAQQEQVKVQHILLENKKDAEAVLAELKNGAVFTELAKEKSVDPGSKDKGGDLGYVARGDVVPEFAEAAFSLAPGETSDIVKTDYGYHIIKVLDKKPARPPNYEESKDKIKEILIDQGVQEKASQWMSDLRNQAKIEYKTEKTSEK